MTPESNFASPAESSAPEAAPKGFVGRLVGVYFSPGETFTEIGRKPDFVAPIIALVLVGLLVGVVMISRIDFLQPAVERIEQNVASGQMTREQADRQLGMMRSPGMAVFMKVSTLLPVAVSLLVSALIAAGLFKLFTSLLGKENRFGALFSVTLYAFLAVSIVQSLLFAVVLLMKSPDEVDAQNLQNLVGSNLGALLAMIAGPSALPKFLMALAGWVDLLSIWRIVLLAVGAAAVTPRLKTSTAGMIHAGMYLVAALIGSAAATIFAG
jgi:hypothetical protein